jgi:hypothetical protein
MKIHHRLIASVGALAMLFGVAASGIAAGTTDSAVVTITGGGTFSTTITGTTFPSTAYSFTDSSTLNASLTLTALDQRGTAAGWKILISSGAFIGTNPSHTFPSNQMSLDAGTISFVGGNNNITAPNQQTFPYANVTSSPVKVWNAAVGYGDGSYSLNVPAHLVVPGGTLVDTYTALVTVAINSAP